VDSWALTQKYLDGGDIGDSSDHTLALMPFKRTAKAGTAIEVDPISFTYRGGDRASTELSRVDLAHQALVAAQEAARKTYALRVQAAGLSILAVRGRGRVLAVRKIGAPCAERRSCCGSRGNVYPLDS
jgi:hypothetical protein